jgi:hypothetical protein
VAGFFENGGTPAAFIRGRKYPNHLTSYKLLKKDELCPIVKGMFVPSPASKQCIIFGFRHEQAMRCCVSSYRCLIGIEWSKQGSKVLRRIDTYVVVRGAKQGTGISSDGCLSDAEWSK